MRKSLSIASLFLIILSTTILSSAQTTVTLNSTFGVDGFVTSGGSVVTWTQAMAGDTVVDTGVRGFVSFDIGTLPSGSNIISATLRIYQEAVNGAPYTDLGNLLVDHLDYGGTLVGADYNSAPIQANIGTLSTDAVIEFKTLDVTLRLQDDIDNTRTRSQYRLLFPIETDNDSVEDAAFFTSANIGGNTPELVVTYESVAAASGIPTMTEWGTIIFIVLVGSGAFFFLRRRRLIHP